MNDRLIAVTAILVSFMSVGYTVYGNSTHEKMIEAPIGHDMTKEQVVEVIKETLSTNPEIIMDSVEKYREAKAQQAVEEQKVKVRAVRSTLEGNTADPRVGPSNASIKIVEFFDYNCGYCKKMSGIKSELLKTDSDVQIIFKELPIMSQDSFKLSTAALAVYQVDPDKYMAFQEALFNRASPSAEEPDLLMIALGLGIDTVKLKAAMNDSKVGAVIQDNMKLAQDIGLRGTPFYVINGEVIPGAADIAELRKQIMNVRAQAKMDASAAKEEDKEPSKEPSAAPVEAPVAEASEVAPSPVVAAAEPVAPEHKDDTPVAK